MVALPNEFDESKMTATNKTNVKKIENGGTISFKQFSRIVLIGTGHQKCMNDWIEENSGSASFGEGQITVAKGSGLSAGELTVKGASGRSEFEKAIKGFSKKKIRFV